MYEKVENWITSIRDDYLFETSLPNMGIYMPYALTI